MERALNYFDGRWTAGRGEVGVCINPADGAPVAQYSEASLDEALAAIDAARKAFDQGPWSRSPRLRESVLLEFAANLQAQALELERWLVTLNGKLGREARGEIATAVSELRFYAGLARNLWDAWLKSTMAVSRRSVVSPPVSPRSSCRGMRRSSCLSVR